MKPNEYKCPVCGKPRKRFVFVQPPHAKFGVRDRVTGKPRFFMCEKCWLPRMIQYYAEAS